MIDSDSKFKELLGMADGNRGDAGTKKLKVAA